MFTHNLISKHRKQDELQITYEISALFSKRTVQSLNTCFSTTTYLRRSWARCLFQGPDQAQTSWPVWKQKGTCAIFAVTKQWLASKSQPCWQTNTFVFHMTSTHTHHNQLSWFVWMGKPHTCTLLFDGYVALDAHYILGGRVAPNTGNWNVYVWFSFTLAFGLNVAQITVSKV